MTNQRAIDILTGGKCNNQREYELAMKMAVEALREKN